MIISPVCKVAITNRKPIAANAINNIFWERSLCCLIASRCSFTILSPRDAGTHLTLGAFSSSSLGYTRTSSKTSFGNNSVIDLANIDFPVPGSPIINICRLCSAAFFITTEPVSCPITWSTKVSGIGTSSVEEKSTPSIHLSTDSDIISSVPVGSGAQMVTSS